MTHYDEPVEAAYSVAERLTLQGASAAWISGPDGDVLGALVPLDGGRRQRLLRGASCRPDVRARRRATRDGIRDQRAVDARGKDPARAARERDAGPWWRSRCRQSSHRFGGDLERC